MRNIIFYLLLLAISTNNYSYSQNVVIDEAIQSYRYYFIVADRESNYYWDRHHSNNLYCNSKYNGKDNQKWMVMPTYPGSSEAMFINLGGGEIVDRSLSPSSIDNLYCFDGKHHGGNNQLFYATSTGDDYFLIESVDRPLAIDKNISNNLYGHSIHWGDNQQFKFIPVGVIPNSDRLNVVNSFNDEPSATAMIAPPPQPMGFEDPGSFEKHSYSLVSKTIIPFAYINDPGRDYEWQAKNSPFYILERFQYWKLETPYNVGYGLQYVQRNSATSGLTVTEQNQLETTFGMKQTYGSEIVIPFLDKLTATLSSNFEQNMGLVIKTNYTVEETLQIAELIEFSKSVDEPLRIFTYRLVEEFKLYRLNGSLPYVEWDNVTSGSPTMNTYPFTNMVKNSSFKTSNSNTTTFFQTLPENLIPRMYSNNSPTGQAEASSSFSTTYSPWKAFDGEDESGAWSRWISKPTGSFTEEWISYEFDESITLMAYNITPETGGSISRTPYQWKVQGWNGDLWQTIDSRTGYSIADWQSNNSRQFSIQYPKKFRKYRLLVEEVNGSDVVSIRKFKLFGLENGSSLKSDDTGLFLNDISFSSLNLETDVEIIPNPNDGRFVLRINDLQNYIDDNYANLDSIGYVRYHNMGIDTYDDDLNGEVLIEVFDIASNKLLESRVNTYANSLNVDFGELPGGVYILKATLSNRKTITKKFIVE